MILTISTLAAPAQAAEPTTFTGSVNGWESGQTVPDACVTLFRADVEQEVASGCVDETGLFSIDAEPGEYKLRAQASGYPEQWYHQRTTWERAHPVTLRPDGAWVTFYLYSGFGDITGTITDFDGTPAVGVTVTATGLDSGSQWSAETGPDGAYTLPDLRPGQFYISTFYGSRGRQYVYGVLSAAEATVFDLVAGQSLVVDEVLLEPGNVQVKIVDSVTGKVIRTGCVRVVTPYDHSSCAIERGVFTVTGVPAGSYYEVEVSPEGTHWPTAVRVDVLPGKVSKVTVPVDPATALVTKVRATDTGDPVADVCASLIGPDWRGVGPIYQYQGCSDANGRLVIGPLEGPVQAQIFLEHLSDAYGAQWVGPRGGTGDQREAVWFSGADSVTTTIKTLRVDPPGSITGVVRDQATGSPVQRVCAFPYALASTLGLSRQSGAHCSNSAGVYTVSGLGPYEWPLQHVAVSGLYPWTWSGSQPDRFSATYIPVRSGQASTADLALRTAGSVQGRTLAASGTAEFGYMTAYSAATGDPAGPATSTTDWSTGGYELLPLAPGQQVKINYYFGDGSDCWYDGASDFATATAVSIPSTTPVTGIDLVHCGTP
ncbi:carboxypeptidase regulatory-like domain-containing protein [Micromonospora sp. LOL_023]|uniref:carboxypeptidase regulatory-like domain-containing protein n=1 Tax=Micromonospora sp. LOL_023 TaxID=3345418 RepID=UPI003A8660F9